MIQTLSGRATGEQVWRTPTTGGHNVRTKRTDGGSFDSGYVVSHTTTEGTSDKGPEGVTIFQAIGGGGTVRVLSSYSNDDVYDIVVDTAVMTNDNLFDSGLKGVDLAQGGKTVWRIPEGRYMGVFGPNLLIGNGRRIQQVDPVTGQRRSDVALSEISGDSYGIGLNRIRSWTYDPDSHAIVGSGDRTMIIDGDTGRLRWRQDGANPRTMTASTAGGGVAFMRLEPAPAPPLADGSSEDKPMGFLALDDRTGEVLADNLPLTAITITDSKYALVEYGGDLYSFRLKASR